MGPKPNPNLKQIRNCRQCGISFNCYKKETKSTCSKSCAAIFFKKARFKEGHTAWNKGLIGYRSGENHHFFGKRRPDMTGNNNPMWKGGKSREKHSLNTYEYKNWRNAILKRDKYSCRIQDENCCNQLEVHHLLRWADYPGLRYVITNGITLCKNHHPRKKSDEKETLPYLAFLINEITV